VAVGSERCARDTSRRCIRAGVMVLLAAIVTAGTAACTRASASTVEPAPTYIPQPTPDPTMALVIQGGGSPVVYLPPLEMKGSPTPVPAARPGSATGARPAAKPAQATRETAPARESAPAARPTTPAREPAPAAKPAPTATRPPANSGGARGGGSGASAGGQPAIINPNTALPGAARPNPTPGR
jgi:hypothetical protein